MLHPPTLVTTIQLKGYAYSLAFSPNGRLLAVGEGAETSDTASVSVFSTDSWEAVSRAAIDDTLPCVRFSPDGRLFGASGFNGSIRLFDVDTGDHHMAMSMGGPVTRSMSFASDSKRLAVTGTNHVVIWNVDRGDTIAKWRVAKGLVNSVAFRPGSDEVAVAGHLNIVNIWDSTTEESKFKETSGQGTALAFSPNGKTVASISYPQEDLGGGRGMQTSVDRVLIMDAENGSVLHDVEHRGASCLEFSFDNQILAVGGDASSVMFYDVQTMQPIGELLVATGQITALAFSADGSYLATASEHEGIVQIWNVSRLRNR